jgi:hypothetical protein
MYHLAGGRRTGLSLVCFLRVGTNEVGTNSVESIGAGTGAFMPERCFRWVLVRHTADSSLFGFAQGAE